MRESALLFRCIKTRVLTRNLPPGYLRKGTFIMAKKCLGLGLIPIALPLFLLIPLPALACGYSDVFCSLRSTVHNAINRYVGEEDNAQKREQQSVESVTRPRSIEDDTERYKQSSDPTVRTAKFH